MNSRIKQGFLAGLVAAGLALLAWFAADVPFYVWESPLERASSLALHPICAIHSLRYSEKVMESPCVLSFLSLKAAPHAKKHPAQK